MTNLVSSLLAAQLQNREHQRQALTNAAGLFDKMNQRDMMAELQPQVAGGGLDSQSGNWAGHLDRQSVMTAAGKWNQDPFAMAESLDPTIKAQMKKRLGMAGQELLRELGTGNLQDPAGLLFHLDRKYQLGEDGISALLALTKTYAEMRQSGQKHDREMTGGANTDALAAAAYPDAPAPVGGVDRGDLEGLLGKPQGVIDQEQKVWESQREPEQDLEKLRMIKWYASASPQERNTYHQLYGDPVEKATPGEIKTGMQLVLQKYGINTEDLFSASGVPNFSLLMGIKDSSYQALERAVQEGRAGAREDLSFLNKLYDKLYDFYGVEPEDIPQPLKAKGYTMEDVYATADKYGMTPEEVIQQLMGTANGR